MKWASLGLCLAALAILLGAVCTGAQDESTQLAVAKGQGKSGKRIAALNFVRFINTRELESHLENGKYALFSALAKTPKTVKWAEDFERRYHTKVNLENESEPLPGFKLSMVVSSDGSSYKLFLVDKDDKCLFGFFTDESGLISHGKNIECKID